MDLTVSVVQMAVAPAQPGVNVERAEARVAEAAGEGAQLVCLPEMWTTGFQHGQYGRLAAEHDGIVRRVADMARSHGVWLNGSMLALDGAGRPANTSFLFNPDGQRVGVYRKAHLFTLVQEDRHLAAGDALCAVDAPWGSTGLSICYDLRFPELFRSYALRGVALQLLPAGWPHPRLEHWRTLLRARAIENQMFIVAANQVGTESIPGVGEATYCGHSAIIDPWGEALAEAGEDEQIISATIDVDKVQQVREKMTVLRDRRPGLYELG